MPNRNSRRAARKDGKPCRAAAPEGGLCFFHANPKKASELGRMGGLKNRTKVTEIDSLPALDSPSKISAFLDWVISETHAGHLRPRVAATLGPLLNARLRAIELTNMELRIKQLEQRLELALSEDETSIPKLQERIRELEGQLAKGERQDKELDKPAREGGTV
jgi:hypothetical protein